MPKKKISRISRHEMATGPSARSIRGLPLIPELPRVVLVGAVNAGKSTLFNKLIGRRQAVVTDRPGTTRDWQIAEVRWAGRRFAIVDTGGLFGEEDVALRDIVLAKAREALQGARLAVLVVDSKRGLTAMDEKVSEVLRWENVPVVLAINKVDGGQGLPASIDFIPLGWENVVPLSALHGSGTGDLLDVCVEGLPISLEGDAQESTSVAVVGVPNAGKSSLMNALVGHERAIVYDKPGTTRDVLVDTYTWEDKLFLLADTAGVRRRSKVTDELETISVSRSMGAASRCDVAVLVVDLSRGFTDQDKHLGNSCLDKGSALIIFGNKLDLVKKLPEEERPDPEEMKRLMAKPFVKVGKVQVILGSALKKWRVHELKSVIALMAARQNTWITTPELNDFLAEADGHGAFAGLSSPKLMYGTQLGCCPPSFAIKVGRAKRVTQTGVTYLMRKMIQKFSLQGCPIQLQVGGRGKED